MDDHSNHIDRRPDPASLRVGTLELSDDPLAAWFGVHLRRVARRVERGERRLDDYMGYECCSRSPAGANTPRT